MPRRPRIPAKKPDVGSLRLYRIINPPAEPQLFPVKDLMHGLRLLLALADSDLLDPDVVSNVYGLEVYGDDGEWCDWENENGEDISSITSNLGTAEGLAQDGDVRATMETHGSGFVQGLAALMGRADAENLARLEIAFYDFLVRYQTMAELKAAQLKEE